MLIENKLISILDCKGLSQEAFGKRIGMSRNNVNRLINNKKHLPTLKTAFKVAKALGVGLDDIWYTRREAKI